MLALLLPAQVLAQVVSFNPEGCSFGKELDAEFESLQDEHDAGLEAVGLRFRYPDEERGGEYSVTRELTVSVPGQPQVSAISIAFDQRMVYFRDDLETVLQWAEKRGFYRPGEDGYLGNVILPNGEEADRGTIFGTQDYRYDEAQGETVAFFDPRGKSGIACAYPQALRLAEQSGLPLEEFATFRPDKAIWTDPVARAATEAEAARAAGDFDKATRQSRELLDLLDAAGARKSKEYAAALDSHGQSLVGLGRQWEALELFRSARSLAAETMGLRHPVTTGYSGHYASTLNSLRPGDEAWWEMTFVRGEFADLFGDDDPRTLAALNQQGIATGDIVLAGREEMLELDDARSMLLDGLKRSITRFGPKHPDTLAILFSLGLVLDRMDEKDRAAEAISAVIVGRRELLGTNHPLTLQAISAQADFRLRDPAQRSGALGAALVLTDAWKERRLTLATTAQDEAQRAREMSAQKRDFLALAEASWWNVEGNPDMAAGLRGTAFLALQEAMAGSTDRAVALMAARRAADAAGTGLGELAARRQALADEWSAVETRLTALLGASDPAAERAALSARQDAIETELAQIDQRLQAEAPAYFAFTRPQALDLSETQRMLEKDEAVLLLQPTPWGTHVFAVTRKSVAWHRSDWTDRDVGDAVRRLLWDVGGNVKVASWEEAEWSQQGSGAYPYDRGDRFCALPATGCTG
ncbi:MAG: hypothetical protein KDD98_00160 [Sphingomonadaceae bacterium]|nr:hypothetical protein [Sphingomonadaceae bacterium]